jgi:hypothetical protein
VRGSFEKCVIASLILLDPSPIESIVATRRLTLRRVCVTKVGSSASVEGDAVADDDFWRGRSTPTAQ